MERRRVDAGTPWGNIVGYSRAVRAGNQIFVSGTTAAGPDGNALHPGDAGKQAEVVVQRIASALEALGASVDDVVETRIYLTDLTQWEAVGRAHAAAFGTAMPATALLQVAGLLNPTLLVEICAIAVVSS